MAQKMYSEMTADERVVCAEKLDEFHLNPISVTFDDEFIQQINQKLDAGSVEALRSKKRAQTKGVAGVNSKMNLYFSFCKLKYTVLSVNYRIENNRGKTVSRHQVRQPQLASPPKN